MIKSFKILLAALFILVIGTVNNVEALEASYPVYYNKFIAGSLGSGAPSGFYVNFNTGNYNVAERQIYLYTYRTTQSGAGYDVYCLDPGLSSQINTHHNVTQTYDGTNDAYGAGLLAILGNEEIVSGLNEGQKYMVRLMAARVFDSGLYGHTKTSGADRNSIDYTRLVYTYAKDWANSAPADVKTALDDLNNANLYSTRPYNTSPIYFTKTTSAGSQTLLDVVKSLYYEGIKAAANYDEGGNDTKLSTPVVSDSKITLTDDLYKQVVRTYEMETTGFEDKTLTKFEVVVDESVDMIVDKITYMVNDTEVDTLVGADLSEDPTISVSLHIRALKYENCEEMNYTINYSYEGMSTLSGEVGMMAGTSARTQRFAIYVPGDNIKELNNSITGKINLCPIDCSTKMDVDNTCINEGDDPENAGSITGTDNVLSCVINGIDDAGNSYNVGRGGCVTDSIKDAIDNDNPYCTISCKEDYTSFKFPGIQQTTQGRYFKVGAEIEGTKTCYTDQIDIEAYDIRINEIIEDANENTDVKALIEAETKKLNACSTWDMDFSIAPEISYTYESNYFELIEGKEDSTKLEAVNVDDINFETWTCQGSVNEKYDICTGTPGNGIETRTVTYNGQTIIYDINTATHYKVTGTKTMVFDTKDVFYNVYPSGEIIFGEPDGVEATVVDGLPVSFDLEEGAYSFNFQIDGLGEFYSEEDCPTGRLVDADDDDDSVDDVLGENGYEGDYECYYRVPCDDCTVEFDPLPEPPCPNCLLEIGDLYFRTYSSNNFNPNDRELGYNWSYDYNINDEFGFVAEKAKLTIEGTKDDPGIEVLADATYEEDPILTVDLTPSMARTIKEEYNTESYTNNSLTCYDADKYKNIYCYSNFLDEMSEKYVDEFVFINNEEVYRPSVDERKFETGNYFKIYTEEMPDAGPTTVGGPSWK